MAAADPSLTGLRGAAAAQRLAVVVLVAGALLAALPGPSWLRVWPSDWVLPLTDRVDLWLTWFAREATVAGVAVQEVTRGLAALVDVPIRWVTVVLAEGIEAGRGLNRVQVVPPLSWLALSGAAVIGAQALGGRRLALTVGLACAYLVTFGLWTNAMITMASVIVCVVLAAAGGLALGIWSFRNPRAEGAVRAVMNVMQTVPIFAYLIPTLLLFGYGPAAALIATVAYALPPMVHNALLALKSVPEQTVEGGLMSGCTRRQLLWQVQIPASLPKLALGLNQIVMMSLNMVIIASMIGAGGLGYDVLTALRKLDFGTGLQAGLGIVALAVALDRAGQAAARRAAGARHGGRAGRRAGLLILGWMAAATLLALVLPAAQSWPRGWTLTAAPAVNALMGWINTAAFDTIETLRAALLLHVMRPFRDALAVMPWSLAVAAVAAAGCALGGLRLAATVAGLLAFVLAAGFWAAAMESLYLMSLSVLLALAFGFPLGFWIGLRPRLHAAADLVLDTLQTIPTLVYLLPAVMLFRIGDVSAVIAVASYAFAAAVRYAMAGMIHVPAAQVEAARMSGCTDWQIFRWVRLPAAAPTLVVGVNQTVMMAFSMLVIAALVGTRDLGQEVLAALNQSKVGQGIVAGLAVAALALAADALLKAAGARAGRRRGTGQG